MRNIVVKEHVFEHIMTKEELIRFSMFYGICVAKDSFIVTNNNNVIIGQERLSAPLWIYIKNDLSVNERDEVIKIICERIVLNPTLNVDGEEKYLNSILNEISIISEVSLEISLPKNSYFCKNPIKPKVICGYISKASDEDLETLSIFSRDNWEDIGFGILSKEQANKLAEKKLANFDFKVWRNEKDKVVAMATVHKYGKVALIDGVFADRNERNKGYAKLLMYRITKDLLNEGIMPMLYADRRKSVPNHLYQSIGYEYCGEITEYRLLAQR